MDLFEAQIKWKKKGRITNQIPNLFKAQYDMIQLKTNQEGASLLGYFLEA